MPPPVPAWPARLVRLGRARTMLLFTAFSVLASLLLVALFAVIFDAPREIWPKYYIPGAIIPACVAPIVIHVLLNLVFALDAAHTQAAQQQRELERVQQLDLVGRLASGLAHELNNLLTVVRASVASLGGAQANDDLAAIDDAAQRGARITRRLLSISRHDEIVRVRQSLPAVLSDIQRVLPRLVPPAVRLHVPDTVPPVAVDVDIDAVQHALLNLVLNAREAIGAEGSIALLVQEETVDGVAGVTIAVRDDGRGMSADLLARATEPFVTTRAAHEGTGLGLTIVRRTMEQHGGRLRLTSEPGVGTTAALWFPVVGSDPSPSVAAPGVGSDPTPAPRERAPRLAGRSAYRVLLVDDEAEVRQVTTRILERAGYTVASVADAIAARQWLAEHPSVDVIVTDVMMPGMTGIDLLLALREAGDHTPVLLVSGFSVERVEELVGADRAVRFLAKPWTAEELVRMIGSLAITAHPERTESG